MKTMLWKEWRQARPKLLIGLGFLILIQIRRTSVDFDRWFLDVLWDSYQYFFVSIIFSIIVGIDTIAGERSNGTLDFVLTKPVSATRLLIAKISVGTAILLIVHILFWTAIFGI